jgi:hypothetical protein
LADENHPFGKISLNENWDIIGKECRSIGEIEKYIIKLKENESFQRKTIPDSKTGLTEDENLEKSDSRVFPKWVYALGFIFSFIPIVVWPIVAIGLYRTNIVLLKFEKKRFNNLLFGLMFFSSIFSLYGGYYFFSEKFELMSKYKPQGEFMSDFFNRDIGFAVINEKGSIKNSVYLPKIGPGESETVFLKCFYTNRGDGTIFNAKANFYFWPTGRTKNSHVVFALMGSGAETIYDTVNINNLPKNWKLEPLCVRIYNWDKCPDYEYLHDSNMINNSRFSFPLGDLDTHTYPLNGKIYKCDSGNMTLELLITNTSEIEPN